MKCSVCSAELKDDATFCSMCASTVEKTSRLVEKTSRPVEKATDKVEVSGDKPAAVAVQALPKSGFQLSESPFPELRGNKPNRNSDLVEVDTRQLTGTKGDLTISQKCSFCSSEVQLSDMVHCSECGCISHITCWQRNNGCGEEYCQGFKAHLLSISAGSSGNVNFGPAGGIHYNLDGDGTVEVIVHDKSFEKKALISFLVFLGIMLMPYFFFLTGPLYKVLFSIGVLGMVPSAVAGWAISKNYRKYITIQAPSNSISTQTKFAKRIMSDKENFRFKNDIVEVHLQYVNVSVENFEKYERKLSRDKNALVPSVTFECNVLTIENEYTLIFKQKSRLLLDVVKLAGQIARALDVPMRKMGQGPPLTSQERKRLIGIHQKNSELEGV